MTEFKLIKELGLKTECLMPESDWVRAKDLEALLATAEIQYHRTSCQISFAGAPDTKAFLLGERPIVRDSIESLLKWAVDAYEKGHPELSPVFPREFYDRARKLLASHREGGE